MNKEKLPQVSTYQYKNASCLIFRGIKPPRHRDPIYFQAINLRGLFGVVVWARSV